jgi:hypothetical protein
VGEISVKTGNNARNGGKNSLNRLIRCVCGKKSAQIREILISESAWEEMTCLFAPSLILVFRLVIGEQMIDVLGPEKRRRRTTQEKIAIVQQSLNRE